MPTLINRQAPTSFSPPPGFTPTPGFTPPAGVTVPPAFLGQSFSRLDGYMPPVLGCWLDTVLMGVIIVTASVWWINARPTERPVFKWLVYWLVLASTGGQVWFILSLYNAAERAIDLAAYTSVQQYLKWFGVIAISSRLPSLERQAFVLHRAYQLVDRKLWIIILILPALAGIAACNLAAVILTRNLQDGLLGRKFLAAGAGMEVSVDFILAGVIGWRLNRMKTGFAGTDKLIDKMLKTLAETQLPQAAAALLFLVISGILPASPRQFYVLWYPKVAPILIMYSLIDRASLERQSKSGRFNNTTMMPGAAMSDIPESRHVVMTYDEALSLAYGTQSCSPSGSKLGSRGARDAACTFTRVKERKAGGFVTGNLESLTLSPSPTTTTFADRAQGCKTTGTGSNFEAVIGPASPLGIQFSPLSPDSPDRAKNSGTELERRNTVTDHSLRELDSREGSMMADVEGQQGEGQSQVNLVGKAI